MQKINEQDFINLIKKVKAANDYYRPKVYFGHEPSDELKNLIRLYGYKYEVLPNNLLPILDECTAYIIPSMHELERDLINRNGWDFK